MRSISVRVPSSTSNMGPGFDTLGLALKLYNTVTIKLHPAEAAQTPPLDGMILETVEFFKTKNPVLELNWDRLEVVIIGEIPISRGLGSSVTVRLGILIGLAELVHGLGLGPGCSREMVLDWVIELEGHPDNAVASCLGGMGICSRRPSGHGFGYTRVSISLDLQWVALVPELELSTEVARRLLPKEIPFRLAVENMQNTARLAVCLGMGRYDELPGLFKDHLHQPFRQALIPGFQQILDSATELGALGGFLSGAGSTLMAVVLKSSNKANAVADAMLQTAKLNGLAARVLILEADNDGARVV